MSLLDNGGIGSFSKEITDIIGKLEPIFDPEKGSSRSSNNSQKSPQNSIPLSPDEMQAFKVFCSCEEMSVKEKTAELIKNYIEEKKRQVHK